ncbi:KAP family P-loop NTPase fold protein [Fusobacterium polymorphum]|uniref:Possible P-loop ATPase n=1 Tax=Fusobacterium polymorphum ATCC 10953 TaxID=393480 RepID=A5TXU9_FUSNP|nr:P-loop NTPase fold protein [Fusobacterium polymorphum]EDK89724.1 possible P-loop ATPase [Fusobacterium polymorphum ATCC 10953]WRL69383.1 P-loop NTPase fold protein [Fusobacterium polymorphum]
MKKGFTDSPAVQDSFNISKYINGLVNFIKSCNTPMTIAVQGDWGTGKTSIMTMIKNELRNLKNLNLVWFNTWQFSQFNLGDKLPLTMLNKLVNEVSSNKESENFKYIKKAMVGVADAILGHISGGAIEVSSFLDNEENLFEAIERLKESFQKLVNEKAGDEGRVIIFIDDLDRIEPERAVELLEVLKIFLDCEKCIFVLAIDYSVVTRGVKVKYGNDFSEGKGKSFFDKIIQVPFKMPVGSYDISLYVKKCFEDIGMEVEVETLPQYINLIKYSIGNNPRSMKRLFNSFLLLSNISDSEILEDSLNRQILFALLCMQSSYELMYNYIIEKRLDLDGEFFNELKNEKNDIFKKIEMNEKEISQFTRFMENFYNLLDKDGDGEINKEDEMEVFRKVLNFSTVTSSSAEVEENEDSILRDYRFKNRNIARTIKTKLNKGFKVDFGETYKKKGIEISNWWIFRANTFSKGANPLNLEEKFGVEFVFKPNIENNELIVDFNIYHIEETTVDEIKEVVDSELVSLKEISGIEPEFSNIEIHFGNIFSKNYEEIEEDEIYEEIKKYYDIMKHYFKKYNK